jgi:hypothetical protein
VIRPSFCTRACERVYITAQGCETVLGSEYGLPTACPGGQYHRGKFTTRSFTPHVVRWMCPGEGVPVYNGVADLMRLYSSTRLVTLGFLLLRSAALEEFERGEILHMA